ncbi:MAG TPA: hypothetical protein VH255_00625, partial [Verrucomicrobiae bacterium]|nr:hypothetical protein [Verrucomicrobiae bacterium]
MKKYCLTLAIAGVFALSAVRATTITENFSSDPTHDGWKIFGDPTLFNWNSTNNNLEVTWDSTHPNSYFYHPLDTILTRYDDFSIEFDLLLNDVVSGTEPGKTGPLQVTLGFQNFAVATNDNFMRGVYFPLNDPQGAINLVEFNYFPFGFYDFGGGEIFDAEPTTQPVLISTNGAFAPTTLIPFEFELPTNQLLHISMCYTASNQTIFVTVRTNGVLIFRTPDAVLTDVSNSLFQASDNFHLDTVSISSYSSEGDDFDSLLAHGTVGNITVTTPPPPILNFTGNPTNTAWQGQFISRSNWLYTLERTVDFGSWSDASVTTDGNATNLFLQDLNSP